MDPLGGFQRIRRVIDLIGFFSFQNNAGSSSRWRGWWGGWGGLSRRKQMQELGGGVGWCMAWQEMQLQARGKGCMQCLKSMKYGIRTGVPEKVCFFEICTKSPYNVQALTGSNNLHPFYPNIENSKNNTFFVWTIFIRTNTWREKNTKKSGHA